MKKLYIAYGVSAAIILISGYWTLLFPLGTIAAGTALLSYIIKQSKN